MANLPQWLRDIDALMVADFADDWEESKTNPQVFTWLKTPIVGVGRVSIEDINSYLYDHALLEPLMGAEATNTKAATLARMLLSEAASDIDNAAWAGFVDELPSAIDSHKDALKALGGTTSQRIEKLPSINQLENTRVWVADGRPDAAPTEA